MEILWEDYFLERRAFEEKALSQALESGTSRKVDSKEGHATTVAGPDLFVPPLKRSEVGAPNIQFDPACGEARIVEPVAQRPRTKLIFDVALDYQFLD